MKHKLQTLLKHKLQWLLLLAALLGVSQGVWGYTVYFDNTNTNWSNVYIYFYNSNYWNDNGSGSQNIASGPNAMTHVSGNIWSYENNGNYTRVAFTKDNQSGYGNFHQTEAAYSDGTNFNVTGSLSSSTPLFTPSTTKTTKNSNVPYYSGAWSEYTPPTPYTVYFDNTNTNWSNVYIYFYNSNYWNDNGSGSQNIASGPNAMTHVSGNIWSYENNGNYTRVAFTKDNQSGYGNFHQTEAAYSDGTNFNVTGSLSSSTPLFTPSTTKTTKNSNVPYYSGAWSAYSSCTTPTISAVTPSSEQTESLSTNSETPSAVQAVTAEYSGGNQIGWTVTPSTISGYSAATFDNAARASTNLNMKYEGEYTATFGAGCGNTTDATLPTAKITVNPSEIYLAGPLLDGSGVWATNHNMTKNGLTFTYEWTAERTSGQFTLRTSTSPDQAAYIIPNYAKNNYTGITAAGSGNHNLSVDDVSFAVGERVKVTATYVGWNSTEGKPEYNISFTKVCSNPTAQTVSGTATICSGSSTNVTVASSQSGYTYVLYKDGSATATTQPGSGSALNFSVSESGAYTVHAYYTSGSDAYCKADMTGSATVTVDATSVAGSITADASSVCNGNGTTLTLGGKTGNVTKWQMSTTSSSTGFSDIANTTTSLSTGSLTQNTWYRAVVKNGVCAAATSTAVGITVVARPSITTQPVSTLVACSGGTPSPNTLSVSATGTDLSYQWQISSTSTEGPWKDLDGKTSSSFTIGVATTGGGTYYYRCKITSATCSDDPIYTDVSTLTVVSNPTAGTISGSAEACSGVSGDVSLTLSGHTSSGTGIQWQKSTDSGSNWSNIAGATSASLSTSQTVATQYRAVVTTTLGSCSRNTSAYSVAMKASMALTSISLSPSTICTGGESTVTANGLVLSGGSVAYTSSAKSKATVAKVSDSEATVRGVAVGNATITATLSGGCGSTVTKTADISVSEGPAKFTLTAAGGTTICSAGGKLRLSGSESGFSYQLYKNGSAYRSLVEGDGNALEFDVFESGDYVCRAYLTSSPSCYTVMTGEVTLHISLTPTLIPATPTVTSYTPVTITSINTDILTWEISGEGNTAYLYDKTSNTVKVKASAAGSPYTIRATTSGGCSQTATLTVNADVEVCN